MWTRFPHATKEQKKALDRLTNGEKSPERHEALVELLKDLLLRHLAIAVGEIVP